MAAALTPSTTLVRARSVDGSFTLVLCSVSLAVLLVRQQVRSVCEAFYTGLMRWWAALLVSVLAATCGQKGPLTLPDEAGATTTPATHVVRP